MTQKSAPQESVDVVTWHEQAWLLLEQAYEREQLSHALLISGMAGIAKETFTAQLVKKLFCFRPEAGRACGNCKNCHLIAAGTHPDLISVSLPEDKKRISVDQVRDTIQKLEKTAQIGPIKVAVIEQLELLTTGAFNAILKTLEEPGRDTYLILNCEQLQKVPATIKSRCMHVPLLPVSQAATNAWLLGQDYSQSDIDSVWSYVPGAPLTIKHWLDHEVLAERERFSADLNELAAGQLNLETYLAAIAPESIPFLIDALLDELLIKVRTLSMKASESYQPERSPYWEFMQQVVDEKRYVQGNQGANALGSWSSLLVSWIELHRDLSHSSREAI